MKTKTNHSFLISLVCSFLFLAQNAFADLNDIKTKGQLKVALYKDFPPFSDNGKGIDVDIAELIAKKLGASVDILWFAAGEQAEDDLRNFVWKGHYLGYGVANMMMHVPVDSVFADRNKNTRIFAPYYRERMEVAINLERIPKLLSLDIFANEKIGVELGSGSDLYLLSAQGGKLRNNVVHYNTAKDAMVALKAGEISAVMATRSDLEAGLGANTNGYEIDSILAPGLPSQGWNLGVAVKSDNADLAQAVEKIIGDMLRNGTIQEIFKKYGISYSPPQ